MFELGSSLVGVTSLSEAKEKQICDRLAISAFNDVVRLITLQKQHFFSQMNLLYSQKRPWESRFKFISKMYSHRKTEWEYIFKSEVRGYLNVYEYACCMYLANAINKDLFKECFKDEVISIFSKDWGKGSAGISVKDSSTDIYCCIRKVYGEFSARY